MAEIKSSLEIAMERAAALGGGGKEEIAREEGAKRGQVAARKLLIGELESPALTDEISALAGEGRAAARQAAAGVLLEAVPQIPPRALAGLRALAEKEEEEQGIRQLALAVNDIHEADLALAEELAGDMIQDLAQAGISGSAVTPNPTAHPQFNERRKEALSDGFRLYNEAAGELAEVFGLR
jgi:anti-sigma factor ChrR (cupin superfamily)